MSPTIWIKFNTRLSVLLAVIRKNCTNLFREIKNNPADGLSWWLKNRHQYDDLAQALSTLHAHIENNNFTLLQVYLFFTSFNFRDDDMAHAEWYQQAQFKIKQLEKQLDPANILLPNIFHGVLSELRYISEADRFHQRWGLVPLQKKVKRMYNQLLEKVESLKKLASEAQVIEQKRLVIDEKRLELEKIKIQKEALQLQKEKVQLLKDKIVEEKQLLEIRHQEHLEQQRLFQIKQQKLQADAETRRREELESSYADLANEWDSQPGTH